MWRSEVLATDTQTAGKAALIRYNPLMLPDKIFYPAAAVIAVVLIALSLVWPQGLGAPSPAPFGHEVQLPDYYRMIRERDARLAREAKEKEEARAKAAAEASSVAAEVQ